MHASGKKEIVEQVLISVISTVAIEVAMAGYRSICTQFQLRRKRKRKARRGPRRAPNRPA